MRGIWPVEVDERTGGYPKVVHEFFVRNVRGQIHHAVELEVRIFDLGGESECQRIGFEGGDPHGIIGRSKFRVPQIFKHTLAGRGVEPKVKSQAGMQVLATQNESSQKPDQLRSRLWFVAQGDHVTCDGARNPIELYAVEK